MRLGFGLVILAALVGTDAASAVSVTNKDDKDQKLTVVEGDAKADHVLKPNSSLDGVCLKGCVIRLGDSANDEYELEGTEVVSIEDGYLYYDGPEGADQGRSGVAAPSPAPAAPPK